MDSSKEKNEGSTCYCEYCHTEIPLSAAIQPEGMDYVRHFCGDQCFKQWENEQSKGDQHEA